MGFPADQFERLRAALASCYCILRELGRGGMATAQDLKYDRRVAVKVLNPDRAASLGPDRFLREIRIAAEGRSSTRIVTNPASASSSSRDTPLPVPSDVRLDQPPDGNARS